MDYPYLLLNKRLKISPIFPDLKSTPLILDLSVDGSFLDDLPPGDQRAFQGKLDWRMNGSSQWGLSSYLENRKTLLSTCQQMVKEERFYHLGLDIIVKAGTDLHSPLDATVIDAGFEEGIGNYGGFIMLEHSSSDFETFYSLYGHLNPASLIKPGARLTAGESFGEIGEFEVNGNWFTHTHLQILTEEGLSRGMQFKGYCRGEEIVEMDRLCPSPFPLFLASRLIP
ncbi:peptidoglycan DD-metalloendopeptidase family protein [Oceanispirochaeta sp.]|uniref:peptidoglycan DD-metalloendopeptidase family protein n=1 Tax=Oceanispirochaeta sp. TaxID=2035350 RepID=UPI00261B4954|nr:peptidoglycan DD-metalloendopeptidase family protein [Oceanispirochaeta sp.]MDA3956741.1 peptidoglycan DD-metalloendopeptidase family protein [Oceanispirochaeta sp.]